MPDVTLHPAQSEVIQYLFKDRSIDVRYATVVASRGFGKSFMAATAAVSALEDLFQYPSSKLNKNVVIMGPTHKQTRDIYWPLLHDLFDLGRRAKFSSKALGVFEFDGGVTLSLWSDEAVERLRGNGVYFVVCDEAAYYYNLKESWESVIHPCLTTRWPGHHRALLISTPKGIDYFYDMCHFSRMDPRWRHFHYTYRDSPLLDSKEIDRARRTVDPLRFRREYECSFEDTGSMVFYQFSRSKHVKGDLLPFQEGETVHVAVDFNIGKMHCIVFADRDGELHILDEHSGSNNTEELAQWITEKYGDHRIHCYPDPSGRARKTSAPVGQTDFTILQGYGIKIFARSAAPSIIDSANAVNRKLENAAGEIHTYIDPQCIETIMSFERTCWKENKAEIDKTADIEHKADAWRYAVEYLYPIQQSTRTTVRGFNF